MTFYKYRDLLLKKIVDGSRRCVKKFPNEFDLNNFLQFSVTLFARVEVLLIFYESTNFILLL